MLKKVLTISICCDILLPSDENKATHRGKEKMTNELMKRMDKAMKRIGGPLAVLELPEEVRNIITSCEDYETRVKMLELVADQLGK